MRTARNPALDLVRCVALFGVIFTHFLLHSGFYDEMVQGNVMYLMTLLRSASFMCVPLFILLSGYLMSEKTLSVQYFKNIEKTIVIYLLASLFCGSISAGYNILILREDPGVFERIMGLFDFSTAPYAWYVEMYIGLYFLIPFLNILWHGLPGKKEKQLLLCVLLCMTALPRVINIFRFDTLSWWISPAAVNVYHKLIPSWWTDLYPLTYYFLGCYLREYPLTLPVKKKLLIYCLSILVIGSFNFYRCLGSTFYWGPWQEWGSLFNVIQSVLLFDLLAQMDLSGISLKKKVWLARMSDCCFGAYLVSWVFDTVFYLLLGKAVPTVSHRFPFLLVTVPAIFLCSLATSSVLNWIYHKARRLLVKTKTA